MEKAQIRKKFSTVFLLLMLIACAPVFARARRRPVPKRRSGPEPMRFGRYETNMEYTGINNNRIDGLVMTVLRRQGIQPANLCSDEVFIRRVYLDVNGSLPEPQEVRNFLQNRSPHKRATLINRLLKREEFADYWSLKWCDLLRVKAEFPINLWPNAVQAYHRWIHDCLRDNVPYDKFVRELLTSSGSNFRVPQVNFYRAIQGHEPSTIAGAVSLTFMGVRPDQWPEARRAGMEAFFSRVAYKGTAEWKEEIVYLEPTATEPLKAVYPDGVAVEIKPGEDPRVVFADWLITPGNPWFARNIVNRIWAWLLGRESSIPRSNHPKAETMFACYPVRRLEAEVLVDALGWISGTQESYSSPIPEPFTFIPEENRTIELADGSISSQFLEMFGRPSRDTGMESERNNQPSDAQRLHLLNSSHVQKKIERSKRLNALNKASKGKRDVLIGMIYLNILSRYPMQKELAAAEKYFETKGIGTRQGTNDLAWALINSKEFLYRH